MIDKSALDALWIMIGAVLVLMMQGGFLCLESGLTRSKNAINVALKNAFDLIVAALLFWLLGFTFMFGQHDAWSLDMRWLAADFSDESLWHASFFLFQLTFCATAATIVSGAIAERSRFRVYVLITAFISLILYPTFGHWAWSGAINSSPGWLEALGFTDFAGSTVVHSLGGWVALAAVIVIGPRTGRFVQGKPQEIPGSNLPLAILGMLFFMIGWIGFNGGSTLEFNEHIAGIVVNTIISASAGGMMAMILSNAEKEKVRSTSLTINGTLAGLVAITAGCHLVSTPHAALIGAIGALVMFTTDRLMLRYQLDDAISAVPVHLAAGIWGTLAVALFGHLDALSEPFSRIEWIGIQLIGILVCGLFVFPSTYVLLSLLKHFTPLRVSLEAEHQGLNFSEHGARTELSELLSSMQEQERTGDLKQRVPVEPFTEVGQIAAQYNRVMSNLNRMIMRTRLIVRDMQDGIITFSDKGIITSANPGAEVIFGRSAQAMVGTPSGLLLHEDSHQFFPATHLNNLFVMLASSTDEGPHELVAIKDTSQPFPIEVTTSASPTEEGIQYSALIRDISERKRMEARLHRHSELAQVTLEAITEAVITCDAQKNTVYLNPMACTLLGWDAQAAFGLPIDTLMPIQGSEGDRVLLSSLCSDTHFNNTSHSSYTYFKLKNKQGKTADCKRC